MIGDLVFANVLDKRAFDAEGEGGPPGIYLSGLPGRALPFVIYRGWKVPQGVVQEEVRFSGPSGRLVWRWGPKPKRMFGSMDLTTETDVVEDAHFDEWGQYVVSFIIEGQILGEIEVPVLVQSAPQKLPKEVEDGLKKSDTIWVGTNGDRPNAVPVWFIYLQGKIYLLSQKEPGAEEQSVPGIPGSDELVVITRRKYRDTSLDRFYASVRILESGPEFEEIAKLLVDRRRSRHGPPEESLKKWRQSCVIAELTPVMSA